MLTESVHANQAYIINQICSIESCRRLRNGPHLSGEIETGGPRMVLDLGDHHVQLLKLSARSSLWHTFAEQTPSPRYAHGRSTIELSATHQIVCPWLNRLSNTSPRPEPGSLDPRCTEILSAKGRCK